MQQWMHSLSFPNYNELSFHGLRILCCNCSDESCRRCRVPLQSATVQSTICTAMDVTLSHFQILMNSVADYQELCPHFVLSNKHERMRTITNPLMYRQLLISRSFVFDALVLNRLCSSHGPHLTHSYLFGMFVCLCS